MGHKVTAQDVAREAGVSASTVDRVLNNRGGVNQAKERRVYAAARRLKLDRALDLRDARTLRVAAFIQPPSNPYHAALSAAIMAENQGANPFNIQTRVFHVDPSQMAKTADKVQSMGSDHDAVIICVAQDDRLVGVLDALASQGKPVITLATDIRCSSAVYVGPDNHRAGRLAGDLVGRLLGDTGGDVIVITGLLSMIGHEERQTGFRDVLEERYPACRVTNVFETREQGDEAGNLVYRELKQNPKIRGIYNASAGAQPVVDALQRLGRSDDVVFVTHELSDDRRRLLQAGAIDAVIDQNPKLEVETAIKIIAGSFGRFKFNSDQTVTPVTIYMRENC